MPASPFNRNFPGPVPRPAAAGWRSSAAVAAVWFAVSVTAGADPRVPADDAEVLETLPRVLFHARDELAGLKDALAQHPDDVDAARRLAGYYVQIGKRESDPRFYGFARATLAPWWERDDAPAAVLKLRAKLKERDHDYAAAREDLARVLDKAPDDGQALIETANLHWVQGRYADARAVLERLDALADPFAAAFARIPLDAVTGRADAAYADAKAMRTDASARGADAVQWVHAMSAEIARALGDDDAAARHFRAGLADDPGDLYLLRGFADLMLDQGRGAEALPILRDHLADTGVLLRAAIAARQSGAAEDLAVWRDRLARRFDEIHRRGGTPHGRYESRFLLEIEDQPAEALRVARENWQLQRQHRDTRNLLEAALAAGDSAAAAPAVAFLREHGTQDAVLQPLIDRLEAP